MLDGKTQSERINPLATSQSRRQGGYEPSTRSRPRKCAKPCSLSTYKDEIVVGDDRCRARCSSQDRRLAEGGSGCKGHETDVSAAGLSQVRARMLVSFL